jgi:molybdopterin/thiamine biosynthesis adenylyltransferase
MTVTLVLPEGLASRLNDLNELEVETGVVLLASPVGTPGGDLRLLIRAFHEVPASAYLERGPFGMRISSEGFVPPLRLAEADGAVPIWTHTHPGASSSPVPSEHDHEVDAQLSDLFRLRSGSKYYGALILAQKDGRMAFTGHLDEGDASLPIDRVLVIGDRIALQWHYQSGRPALEPLFDRNVRAFGGEVQRALGDLRIAVVGCGGTGSAVAEQLVRLGVRHLRLVDPDHLSETNLTRVYGSTPSQVGRAKVLVLGDHLKTIAPDLEVEALESTVTTEATARGLASSDMIFGCTDDNGGRLVLSRMATYFAQPVFDCGVILTSNGEGRLDGIFGRVTTLLPGSACLLCRDRIDLAQAAREFLPPEEQAKRIKEGYAPALPGVEPAVIAFTTAVAASAVTELLERMTRFGVDPPPSEVLLRIHDRETSTNRQAPRERHYCHPDSGKWGMGFTAPLLEQTWQK